MHPRTRTGALILAAALSLSATTAPAAETNSTAAKSQDLFPDLVVAKGKGLEIKRSRVDQELVTIKSSAAARGQTITPDQMKRLEQQILQRLIHIQLLNSRATDADKAKGKETEAKRFDEIKKRAGDDEALARQLKAVGMDEKELQSRMTEEATAEAVLERELKIAVSDADIKKFYDENPSKFEQAERVRAAHVLLSTLDQTTRQELPADKKDAKRKVAEDVLKRAKAGEDFAKLAKDYSDDPGSKDRGGEYTFPRGQMVPEFEAADFSLQTNQVSDIVTTQFGYHIIKTYEKLPAQKIELDKVKAEVSEYLKQQQSMNIVPAYMEKLIKEYGVEILDESLKIKDIETAPAPVAPPAKK